MCRPLRVCLFEDMLPSNSDAFSTRPTMKLAVLHHASAVEKPSSFFCKEGVDFF